MIKTGADRKIDTIFVLIIFCIFALSVLMVLMLGATIYKSMTGITREGQDERMLMSYIWTKVKNRDHSGRIYVGEYSGLQALCLNEEFGGIEFRTVVYYYDGWVYELFSEIDIEFLPHEGIKITRAENLNFVENDAGMIEVSAGSKTLLIYPRSQGS